MIKKPALPNQTAILEVVFKELFSFESLAKKFRPPQGIGIVTANRTTDCFRSNYTTIWDGSMV
jgi:hypothetical protein